MSILAQLSSQVGDRSENANRIAANHCLQDPDLLAEIPGGLSSKDAALAGDCAEVMTLVAAQCPEWVAAYASKLSSLLDHKTTRMRWEAMHAVAFVAASTPETIDTLLPTLSEIVQSDSSTIVRDYAIDAVGNYAGTGKPAAEKAYPLLVEGLSAWDGKHAGHTLKGLANVAAVMPELSDEMRTIAEAYSHSA